MEIIELFENDEEHARTLAQTGFWGSKACGCIILARSTGRLMIVLRSGAVEQPHTWGSIGGAIDTKEQPEPVAALKREVHEEVGYTGAVYFEPLYVFKKTGFEYYNFLAIVDKEFEARLDWENDEAEWFELNDLPSPLHFGLVALFNDAPSMKKIKAAIALCKKPGSPE